MAIYVVTYEQYDNENYVWDPLWTENYVYGIYASRETARAALDADEQHRWHYHHWIIELQQGDGKYEPLGNVEHIPREYPPPLPKPKPVPQHYAETYRADDGLFGWQCLACGADGSQYDDLLIAEADAQRHSLEGTLSQPEPKVKR